MNRCADRHVGPDQTTNHEQTKTMKLTSIVTVLVTSLVLAAGAFSAEKPKYKEGSCCDKAAKKNEKCAHPCCVAAEADKKVCEKCNK